jgi:hypothetical protein
MYQIYAAGSFLTNSFYANFSSVHFVFAGGSEMKQITLALTFVAAIATVASAQDRFTVQLQPTVVHITEGETNRPVNGYNHRAMPMLLGVELLATADITVRAHVALPVGFGNRVQYDAFRDNGSRYMTTYYPDIDLRYRDVKVAAEYRLSKFTRGIPVYALVELENTSFQRSMQKLRTGVIVNGQEVLADSVARITHRTLAIGGGIRQDIGRITLQAEGTIAPHFSEIGTKTDYSTSAGYRMSGNNTVDGNGARLSAGGTYRLTRHVGIQASIERRTFTYQNQFDRDNDLHPQTRWTQFSLGVTTRF